MRILLVGDKSMVARSFANRYHSKYLIEGFDRGDEYKEYINEEYDTVIFLAQSGDYRSGNFTRDLFDVNIHLLFKILSSVKTKKIIYFSSGSVYESSPGGHYSTDSKIKSLNVSPYAASKIAGELIAASFRDVVDSIIILRPFGIYGANQNEKMLIKSIYSKIINNSEIELTGNDGLILNPVFADDVADLIDKLIIDERKGSFTYNVAGKDIVTLREIVNILSDLTGRKAVIKSNQEKSPTLIGEVNIPFWTAETTIKEGLHKAFKSE